MRAYYFIAILCLSLAHNAFASGAAAPPADGHGGGGKKEKKPIGDPVGEPLEDAPPAPSAANPMHQKAERYVYTDDYVHRWLDFPPIVGRTIDGNEIRQEAQHGVLDVVIFVASWCIGCQEMMGQFKKMEAKYRDNKAVRITYVFAHDLLKDTKGYARAYGIKGGIIASHDVLREFHNPPLPSIYVSDRDKWLCARFLRVKPEHMQPIDRLVYLMSSY